MKESILLLIVASVLLGSLLFTTALDAPSILTQFSPGSSQLPFATTVHNQTIHTPSIQEYFTVRQNFTNVTYKKFDLYDKTSMKIGARLDTKRGYIINNQKYVIDLLYCDRNTKACFFRINGVPTKRLYDPKYSNASKPSFFTMNDNVSLQIASITFNFCDHRRFCNMPFEAYDIVQVEVKRGERR
ncbi:hypothetical protein HYW21_07685 [Candidatus Woesearchaeota archaeon]|nr:hypothetical protein [Candidatus Woesearchaeota archaeon]